MIYSQIIILSSLLQIIFTIEIVAYQKCLDFENDNWKVIDLFTLEIMNNICNGDDTQIEFGRPSIFDYTTVLFKIFLNLPVHDNLFIKFKIDCFNLQIDNTYIAEYGYEFYLFVDDIQYMVSCDSNNVIQSVAQSHSSMSITLALQTRGNLPSGWDISDFTLELNGRNANLDPKIFGKVVDFFELNSLSNDGWLDGYQSYKIQNLIEFSLLGSDHMAIFILQKLFLLQFVAQEVEIQFKIFSYFCDTISLDIILNSQIVTVNKVCTYLHFDSLYLAVINLKAVINPINSLNIEIQNSQGTSIIGIRDFQLTYKKYEGNLIPQCLSQINDECWYCEDGWNLINSLKICIPTCGDKIITFNEECDDGNHIPFDGCYNCKFQCDSKCKHCLFGKCLDLRKKKDNIEIKIENCKLDSYYSDSGIYYDFNYQTCLNICGDGIIAINEQCDDGNDIPYDGCYLCQFQCPLHCLNCNNGICMQCAKGYQLNQNKCESYCGDQIITQNEQCDDGNQIQLDGCHNCQFNCQHGCLFCVNNNYCIKCLDGWNLNNGQCQQICNDNKLAILSIEQCDDQSDQYCIDCQIQCSIDNCILCNGVYTCLQCEKPYSLINGYCIPYCGDGMIYQSTEQCDDGNNIQHDGCYNCQFECLEGCEKCDQSLYCTLCDSDSNYVLDRGKCQKIELPNNNEGEESEEETSIACGKNELLIDFECVNQCGNGLIDSEFETCDDGNINGGDGCSFDCQIEDFYTCKNNNNQMSQCSYITMPSMILTNLSAKRSSLQIIQITFSEEVKSNNQYLIENIMSFTIIPNTETIITIKPNINISLTPANVSYLIEVQFQQQVENPELKVDVLQATIYSKQGQQIQQRSNQIGLGEPFILSKQIQLKVDKITEFNNAIIYSMMGIAIIAVLTGNFALLLNLLDLLQQLSYLRYMQYQFPSHLKQFLDSYTKISLKPLFDKLQIDQLIANMNGGNIPYIGQQKNNNNQNIEVNQLNQYYLLNAKSCYLSLILSYGTYKICSFIVSDRVQLFITNKFLLKQNQSKQQLNRLYLVTQYLREKCNSIKKNYFFVGIGQSYFANMHQLLFSSFLQFPNYTFDSWLNVCNSISAIFSLGLIIQVTFITFSLPNRLTKKINKYQFLFNDLNKQYWSLYARSFQMLKSLFYIFIIVFCINYPEVQSFLLSVESTLYLFYLIKYLLFYQKQLDHLKLILREAMLIFITGSFSAYSFQLNHDQLLLFGWLHISMILIIMIGSIILDFIKYFIECYISYQNSLRSKELKLQAMYHNNLLQKFVKEEEPNFYFKR